MTSPGPPLNRFYFPRNGALSAAMKSPTSLMQFLPLQLRHPLDNGAAHHHPVHVRGDSPATCSGVEMPKPTARGHFTRERTSFSEAARSGGSSVAGPGDPGHRYVVEKPLGEAAQGLDALRAAGGSGQENGGDFRLGGRHPPGASLFRGQVRDDEAVDALGRGLGGGALQPDTAAWGCSSP